MSRYPTSVEDDISGLAASVDALSLTDEQVSCVCVFFFFPFHRKFWIS